MMELTCDRVKNEGVAEAYLLGTVDDETRDAFEIHLLDCTECLGEFEILQSLQLELEASREAIESIAPTTRRRPTRMWAMGLAATAVLAVAAALLLGPLITPDHNRIARAELVELADLKPAPYRSANLRGSEGNAAERFQNAMEHYQAGQYEAAAADLQGAAELDPRSPRINFYLGVTQLLTGDTDGAVETLNRTVALGDTLYLEWAHLYLAKAHLLAGEVEAARDELEHVLALEGDLEAEANRLLGGLEGAG